MANPKTIYSEESIKEIQEYAKTQQQTYRKQLLDAVNKIIDDKNWRQEEIALHLGMTQPRVSNLRNGKVEKFSIQGLQEMLTILGYEFGFEFKSAEGRGAHKLTVKIGLSKFNLTNKKSESQEDSEKEEANKSDSSEESTEKA